MYNNYLVCFEIINIIHNYNNHFIQRPLLKKKEGLEAAKVNWTPVNHSESLTHAQTIDMVVVKLFKAYPWHEILTNECSSSDYCVQRSKSSLYDLWYII